MGTLPAYIIGGHRLQVIDATPALAAYRQEYIAGGLRVDVGPGVTAAEASRALAETLMETGRYARALSCYLVRAGRAPSPREADVVTKILESVTAPNDYAVIRAWVLGLAEGYAQAGYRQAGLLPAHPASSPPSVPPSKNEIRLERDAQGRVKRMAHWTPSGDLLVADISRFSK